MTSDPCASVGFIGLGSMGEPMALNLLKAGTPLTVWNRSAQTRDLLARPGASAAKNPADVFATCDTIILMLANEAATAAVTPG